MVMLMSSQGTVLLAGQALPRFYGVGLLKPRAKDGVKWWGGGQAGAAFVAARRWVAVLLGRRVRLCQPR
jgi:hypothetical protein